MWNFSPGKFFKRIKKIRLSSGKIIDAKSSKPILDEIDRALAAQYGFTEEELDFIINYDIKYRMGRDAETAEDSLND